MPFSYTSTHCVPVLVKGRRFAAESILKLGVTKWVAITSENSEYDDAKNEQGMVEARIAEINQILSEATIVDTPKKSNKVTVGAIVTVNMGGKERVFTIVGGAEADVAAGKISNESPVGAALLGHKKDDEVTAIGPTGREIKMTILKIEH